MPTVRNSPKRTAQSLEEDLRDDKDYSENVAEEIAKATLTRERKVVFLIKAMEGYAFFNVEHKQGGPDRHRVSTRITRSMNNWWGRSHTISATSRTPT